MAGEFPGEIIMTDAMKAYSMHQPDVAGGNLTPYAAATQASVYALESAARRGEYPHKMNPGDVDQLIGLTLKIADEREEIEFLEGLNGGR